MNDPIYKALFWWACILLVVAALLISAEWMRLRDSNGESKQECISTTTTTGGQGQ
jgi:hypothetical protein